MDYHHQHQQKTMCSKHNQPIIVVNSDPKIGPSCVICVQNWPGNVSIEQFNQQQQVVYDKVYKEMDLDHQQFQQFLDELLKYKQNIISGLDKIIQLIMDQIKIIKDSMIKMGSIILSHINNKETIIKDIQEIGHKQQLINKDVTDQVGNQLKSFQLKFAVIDQLSKILHNNQIVKMTQENFQLNTKIKIQQVRQEQFKKNQDDLFEESTVKIKLKCYSIAFNNDNTILLAGCVKNIIVYEFMQGEIIEELQKLTNHTDNINCLQFMRKSNSFVSGSQDNTIIIWIHDQNNKWIAQQILKKHTKSIYYILINKIEDELISGSGDCTLKFWKLMNRSWTCQQSLETKYEVRDMSFNEMQDKLIVCENNCRTCRDPQYELIDMSFNEMQDKLIVCENNCRSDTRKSSIQVLVQNNKKKWSVVQTLDFDGYGWRLCFTIRDQFVFTTSNSDLLGIYDYDNNNQQYKKVSQLQIQSAYRCCAYFPCQYIKSLNILTFKHGEYLNIVKVNENYKYELMQKIQFGRYTIYGRMSDDGQYIVTRGEQTQEIKIRKIQYLE